MTDSTETQAADPSVVASAASADATAASAPVPPATDSAATQSSAKSKTTTVRVLVAIEGVGEPNDVVDLPNAQAKSLAKQRRVDLTDAAVTFAKTLPQNKA